MKTAKQNEQQRWCSKKAINKHEEMRRKESESRKENACELEQKNAKILLLFLQNLRAAACELFCFETKEI